MPAGEVSRRPEIGAQDGANTFPVMASRTHRFLSRAHVVCVRLQVKPEVKRFLIANKMRITASGKDYADGLADLECWCGLVRLQLQPSASE